MAWRAPWLSLFSPPPVRGTGHQVKVGPCQCVRRNIRHGSSAHAYTRDIVTQPAPSVLCVRVCVGKHKLRDCEWKRAWTSTDENTDHSRTPVSSSPLCKSVSPFQPPSLPLSLSHSLTHSHENTLTISWHKEPACHSLESLWQLGAVSILQGSQTHTQQFWCLLTVLLS